MIRDITIHDEDREIDYHLTVNFRCREEIGGAPGICCDIQSVFLESCVVWLNKCGMEVCIDSNHRRSWTREIERKFNDEIVGKCIEEWEEESKGAA